MKKLLALTLILVCITASACAEFDQIFLTKYNAAASIFGAPELNTDTVLSKENFYRFNNDQISIMIEMSQLGGVRTASVYTNDETCAADYLCSCLAMIYSLGGSDTTAAGMLLMQYAAIRGGRDSVPYNIGVDLFQIVSGDLGKYSFIYMNNDGTMH